MLHRLPRKLSRRSLNTNRNLQKNKRKRCRRAALALKCSKNSSPLGKWLFKSGVKYCRLRRQERILSRLKRLLRVWGLLREKKSSKTIKLSQMTVSSPKYYRIANFWEEMAMNSTFQRNLYFSGVYCIAKVIWLVNQNISTTLYKINKKRLPQPIKISLQLSFSFLTFLSSLSTLMRCLFPNLRHQNMMMNILKL